MLHCCSVALCLCYGCLWLQVYGILQCIIIISSIMQWHCNAVLRSTLTLQCLVVTTSYCVYATLHSSSTLYYVITTITSMRFSMTLRNVYVMHYAAPLMLYCSLYSTNFYNALWFCTNVTMPVGPQQTLNHWLVSVFDSVRAQEINFKSRAKVWHASVAKSPQQWPWLPTG